MQVILFSGKARSGKDTTADILKDLMEQDNKKVLIAHYADLLKYICGTFFGWNGIKNEEGRNLLQRVGTDVIRKVNPDFWVNFLSDILLMFPDEWDYVLIPDCRFPNEIQNMKHSLSNVNIFTIRITRLDYESELTKEQQEHISETALDNYQFDYYLDAKTGYGNLKPKIEKMYDYIKYKELR